jgi:hypothetical protein
MWGDPDPSWCLTGPAETRKTHLLYAQSRELVHAGRIRCLARTTRELVDELRPIETSIGMSTLDHMCEQYCTDKCATQGYKQKGNVCQPKSVG